MRTSLNGINLIKTFEGFSAVPYLCPAKYLTIGYGHVVEETGIRKLEAGKEKIPVSSFQYPITRLQAEEILRNDLIRFELAVKKLITAPINQNQFDALVSFTYNLGAGALQRSTLRSKVNRLEHELAACEFLKWIYASGRKLSGLVARRRAEAEIYLS